MASRQLATIAAVVATVAGTWVVVLTPLRNEGQLSSVAGPVQQNSVSSAATILSPPSADNPAPTASASTAPPRPADTTARSNPTASTAEGPRIATPITRSAGIDVLAPRRMAAPVGLVIPTLGIDGQVAPTGVNERAELDVPADARTLVWYRFGPSPGEAGSAVIAGHLDWKGALGTFYALDRTPIGEHITVRYDDSQRTFTVTESRSSTSPPSLSTEHSHGTAPACCVS